VPRYVNVVDEFPMTVTGKIRKVEMREIVAADLIELDRHEVDDLYAAALAAALDARAVVLTAAGILPDDAYRRFTHDIAASGGLICADMHGAALDAALDGGTIDLLKVSEDDLAADGRSMGSEAQAVDAATALVDRGAATVVISRGGAPAVAASGGRVVRVTAPPLEEVDHRGAGDSMTGATVAALLLGLEPLEAIRFGAAAGAGNVTRHGLGSGDPALVTRLTELVVLEDLT
jgi:1-phosphofructokinase